jgi:hypothetical protein
MEYRPQNSQYYCSVNLALDKEDLKTIYK